MKKLLLVALVALCASGAAWADVIVGDFTILNGSPAPSGGHIVFSLNPDGTIAATLTTTGSLTIVGFGFDSVGADLPESGFAPTAPDNPFGWVDMYGLHRSGFLCTACGALETWTIGNPGDFASAADALGGGNASYDFFLLTQDSGQYAAVARAPEPASLALLGLALAALAATRRDRRQRLRNR